MNTIDNEIKLKEEIINWCGEENKSWVVSTLDDYLNNTLPNYPITRAEYLEYVLMGLKAGSEINHALNAVHAAMAYCKYGRADVEIESILKSFM